jgi:hypothetical protein
MLKLLVMAGAVGWLSMSQVCMAQLINENLLTNLPDGYKVGYQNRNDKELISEMVPQNETVENWTEMVTVQIFFGQKIGPRQFKARMEKLWASSCPGGEPRSVYDQTERGYATATWVLACPLNPATKKPEITWFKAIQGNDSLYVVQKAFKFMPSQEQASQWLRYLNDVAVCDSRLPDRACPRTKQ